MMDSPASSPLFVDPALAYRLEYGIAWRGVRYTEAYQRLHPQADCGILPVAGGFAVVVKSDSPVNKAAGMGFSGPVMPADLETLEDFFAGHEAAVRILVSPLADHSLFALLRERGYRLSHFFSVLVRPLPDGMQPGPLPKGLRVARAQPSEADLWLQVVGEGFEESPTPSPETLDILGPNFHAKDAAPYFAWIGGEPAGGGGMYYNLEQRVVELGGASTRPPFRRRGVQRALIEARLAHARALGCDLAIVLTTPGSDSQRNLGRAGFNLAYTSVALEKSAAR